MTEYIYGTDEQGGHWLTDTEIVRCKDCKNFNALKEECFAHWEEGITEGIAFSATPNDFCAWGERKMVDKMNTTMDFPDTPEQFLDMFSFTDTEEYYTNGQRCISLHRVRQMLEHYFPERTCQRVNKPDQFFADDFRYSVDAYRCSVCNFRLDRITNYCPDCGAKVVN